MNETLLRRTNLFGAWCGIFYCIALFGGWWVVGGFFPLHKPSAGAEEIAAFFRGDMVGIRVGMVIVMWGAAIFMPFAATVADFVSKIEGRVGPLTIITAMAGFGNAVLTFYPPLWWITATWRTGERSAELIYLFNDAAWLQFVGGLALVMPMFLTVGVAALNDKSERPVFPRWAGFASIMAFIMILPDQTLFFFTTGPFAWNGLIAFWIPVPVFCGWFVLIFFLMRRALLRQDHSISSSR